MTTGRCALAGYELEHRLGEGASGSVWRARQLSSLGRPVAVKRVRVPDGAAQLRTEAGALVELDHPHIVRVFELVPDGDDGIAIAMQLASGGSLEERLARRGPLPADEVHALVRKLAGALASTHRRGVLHHDVKPGNVLFTSDGEPLLADFGVASWSGGDGMVRGTEGYLDPTVLAGRTPDATSDLYTLGAVALEALGGERSALPEPLASVVSRCLELDPAARFSSADELVEALVAPPSPSVPSRPAETRAFGPRPPAAVLGPPARPRWRAVAGGAGALLVAVGVIVATRGERSTPAAGATPRCALVRPVGDDLLGDVDGDGCDDVVGRAANVLTVGHRRYEVGLPADVVVLGDWDCDGRATPAVFRAERREAHLFSGWAERGERLPAVRKVAASAPPADDCR